MILGIDLGTSNSLASVFRGGKVELIPSGTGSYAIPSVVSIDKDGTVYTGEVAREKLITCPDETASMFKRDIGTKKEFILSGKPYTAEKLSAILLQSIKQRAEKYINEEITEAVISVPAFFLNPQRQAVIRAAKLAGLHVRQIINEPTAAAIAYNIFESQIDSDKERVIMVLDLGGGTFDISIMEAASDVMEVVAVCGDNKLGGKDFTDCMQKLFLEKCGLSEVSEGQDREKLWKSAERAKKVLSENGEVNFTCVIGERLYECLITEDEYTAACWELLEKMRKLVIRTISESQYQSHEIDDIIMIGGGTKLSVVRKMINKISGKEIDYRINPDEAVVYGAALKGAMCEKNTDLRDVVMTDICPYYICQKGQKLYTYDYVRKFPVLIPKNHIVPACITFKGKLSARWYTETYCQTEDEIGTGSIELGELTFVVPQCKEEKTDYVKRLIFDNHGILHCEYYFPCIDRTYSTAFSENDDIDDEASRQELEVLRYNCQSNEQEQNMLLLSRAESLYCECLGKDRDMLGEMIGQLEEAFQSKKKTVIAKAKKEFEAFVSCFE